ncbi:hypothetical protein GCM10029964_053140 [Kibdelosporangium lantanae]
MLGRVSKSPSVTAGSDAGNRTDPGSRRTVTSTPDVATAESTLAMFGGGRTVPRSRRIPPWPPVTAADEAAVLRSLRSGAFTAAAAGEQEITALETEWARFVGTRGCVATSNGTTALSLALAAAGIRAGDEVIVPALSFIGSAVAPVHVGAVPVFVDVDPVSFNLDPAAVAAAITPRTKAIVVVHLHGLPADLDEILALAEPRHRGRGGRGTGTRRVLPRQAGRVGRPGERLQPERQQEPRHLRRGRAGHLGRRGRAAARARHAAVR